MTRLLRTSLVAFLSLGAILLFAPNVLEKAQGQTTPPIKVVRPACTDNVCGGCDGRCHDPAGVEYDHLTVRKNGRCCCTPRKGGDLDRAVREAYDRWAGKAGR